MVYKSASGGRTDDRNDAIGRGGVAVVDTDVVADGVAVRDHAGAVADQQEAALVVVAVVVPVDVAVVAAVDVVRHGVPAGSGVVPPYEDPGAPLGGGGRPGVGHVEVAQLPVLDVVEEDRRPAPPPARRGLPPLP
ncbi:hypothetical protein ACH4Q6_19490 [Streptomyces lydicus]|uniref:hypothetical protein n=1 Tax=Streptomyces lydicus TaxID=47763 RepID=UPI003794C6ED